MCMVTIEQYIDTVKSNLPADSWPLIDQWFYDQLVNDWQSFKLPSVAAAELRIELADVAQMKD